jgi:restriction endonuclease S subunit
MKDSGVPWLAEVPEHWEVKPLKRWVRLNQSVLAESTDPDFQFRYLDIGAVETGRLVRPLQPVKFAEAPSRARRIVKQGDTIVSTVRTYLKAVLFIDEPGGDLICSTGFAVLTPGPDIVPKYLSYLIQSEAYTNRVSSESVGIAYPAVAETKVGSFRVSVPTRSEQWAIVRFLDHADKRIRRFIAAKRRLIELLHEQKQAIIQKAVTRGLDANVRLKHSGLEWLGDIPAHWAVLRCGRLFRESLDTGHSTCELLSIDRIRGVIRQVDTGRKTRASEDRGLYKRIRIGELAYNLMNAFMGSIGVSPLEGILSPAYAVAKPVLAIQPWYFHNLFRTKLYTTQFDRLSYGIMYERNRLYFDRFRTVPVPVPPLDEQEKLVEHIQRETSAIDSVSGRELQEVELIREYRTRLISDVVTGKLDVQGVELPGEETEMLGETHEMIEELSESPEDTDPAEDVVDAGE